MIGIIFIRADEILEIRLIGNDINFRHNHYGMGLYPLNSLRLDKEGAIKEHPDLKDDPDWQDKSLRRLKDKLESMKSEDEKVTYLIEDLKKVGFKAKYKQRQGFRPEVIK